MMSELMKYVGLKEFGPASNMVLMEGPRPKVKPGDVLMKVHAAGVNRADIVQRLGNYPPPPGESTIMGLEASGEIVAMGSDVTGFQRGDRVCALLTGGGYAEYVAVPFQQVLPIPRNIGLTEAAAIPETYCTVWTNVFQSGGLKQGETILVHGGASGIGTTAISLARAFGATVYATVGSSAKADVCKSLGAAEAIDYNKENFADRILDITGQRGVDVILDMRAGRFFPDNLRAIAPRGRIVHIASLAGREVTLDIPTLMRKRAIVTGSTLRARSVEEKGEIVRELLDQVWPLFENGQIAPEIFRILPVDRIVEAHELIEANANSGKTVVTF